MGTVTNPLSGLIDGLLQGHNLALQLQRAQDEHQAMLTNEALHNQQMSVQDIQNRMLMQQNGRPVVNGTVQDQMNMPDAVAPTAQPSSISSSLDSAATATTPPSGSDSGAGGTVPGRQLAYLRKPDASRTVNYKDSQGNSYQTELYTPQEQAQRALQVKTQADIADQLAKSQGAQMVLENQRKLRGVPVPADVAESFAPGTAKVLPEEVTAAREQNQKIAAGNRLTSKPGETTYDISDPDHPKPILNGGPPLPTDDFGRLFLPKYLQKKGKTLDGASLDDLTDAQTQYEKSKKGVPTTPTELAIAAIDPSKTPEERDLASRALKSINADKVNVSVNTANAKADAGGLTDDDYLRAGEQYMRTGVMPAMGRDSVTRAKIVHAGNQWARDNGMNAGNVVSMQAAYAGDKDSLKKFQTQRDQIASFEQTATKNLDNFIGLASKVVDTGSPWLNLPLRQLSDKLVGSVNMAAVNAARQVASNEVAKVTSGGGLSGVLSDAARKEVENYNPKDATLKQTLAVAQVLKTDMANRHQAMDATLADIKGRIGGVPAGAPAAAARPAPPGAPQFKVGDTVMYQGKPHKVMGVNNGKLQLDGSQ